MECNRKKIYPSYFVTQLKSLLNNQFIKIGLCNTKVCKSHERMNDRWRSSEVQYENDLLTRQKPKITIIDESQ